MKLLHLTASLATAIGLTTYPATTTATPTARTASANKVKQNIQKMAPITKLVVIKHRREMFAYGANGELLKTYRIALGKNPVGHKRFEGDRKTPEGTYRIDTRSKQSQFHKNLNISYPNASDRAYARKYGRSSGGQIKIHGLPNGISPSYAKYLMQKDWTYGCIAVNNQEIDELFKYVVHNAVIDIRP